MTTTNQWISDYVRAQKATLDSIPAEAVAAVVTKLRDVWQNDRQVFIFGNGGSAANASHFATDLGKGSSDKLGKRFRVLNLLGNPVVHFIKFYVIKRGFLDGIRVCDRAFQGDFIGIPSCRDRHFRRTRHGRRGERDGQQRDQRQPGRFLQTGNSELAPRDHSLIWFCPARLISPESRAGVKLPRGGTAPSRIEHLCGRNVHVNERAERR